MTPLLKYSWKQKYKTKQNSKPLWITITTLHNYTFIFSDFYLKAWFSGNTFFTFVVSLLIAETINKLVAETSAEQIYRRLSCIRLLCWFSLKFLRVGICKCASFYLTFLGSSQLHIYFFLNYICFAYCL